MQLLKVVWISDFGSGDSLACNVIHHLEKYAVWMKLHYGFLQDAKKSSVPY